MERRGGTLFPCSHLVGQNARDTRLLMVTGSEILANASPQCGHSFLFDSGAEFFTPALGEGISTFRHSFLESAPGDGTAKESLFPCDHLAGQNA